MQLGRLHGDEPADGRQLPGSERVAGEDRGELGPLQTGLLLGGQEGDESHGTAALLDVLRVGRHAGERVEHGVVDGGVVREVVLELTGETVHRGAARCHVGEPVEGRGDRVDDACRGTGATGEERTEGSGTPVDGGARVSEVRTCPGTRRRDEQRRRAALLLHLVDEVADGDRDLDAAGEPVGGQGRAPVGERVGHEVAHEGDERHEREQQQPGAQPQSGDELHRVPLRSWPVRCTGRRARRARARPSHRCRRPACEGTLVLVHLGWCRG